MQAAPLLEVSNEVQSAALAPIYRQMLFLIDVVLKRGINYNGILT